MKFKRRVVIKEVSPDRNDMLSPGVVVLVEAYEPRFILLGACTMTDVEGAELQHKSLVLRLQRPPRLGECSKALQPKLENGALEGVVAFQVHQNRLNALVGLGKLELHPDQVEVVWEQADIVQDHQVEVDSS